MPFCIVECSKVESFIESLCPKLRANVFGFADKELFTYLRWASTFNYLFVDSSESGIEGVGVAYPVAKKYNGSEEWFYSFADIVPLKDEHTSDLCVMDFVATSRASRARIASKFMRRFPNWRKQEKYAIRRGKPQKVQNKTIEILSKHGLI